MKCAPFCRSVAAAAVFGYNYLGRIASATAAYRRKTRIETIPHEKGKK